MNKFKDGIKSNAALYKAAVCLKTLGLKILYTLCPEVVFRRKYKVRFQRRLDLKNPRGFNEKIIWYILYYRNPAMCTMADKYAVRGFLQDAGYGDMLNTLYGAWDSAEDVDFAAMGEKFVLKANHSSGDYLICTDKSALDIENAREIMRTWLKKDFAKLSGEWHYGNMKRRIICEKFLENADGSSMSDYKIHCFDGKARFTLVCSNRQSDLRMNYYDMDWNLMEARKSNWRDHDTTPKQPVQFARMVEIAEHFAKEFPFVRVDFFECDGKIYFGEFTFFPANGMQPILPFEWDIKIGDMFNLPEKTKRGVC
ncbi:MAG: ATP-grasp fold amidoligase family protein [Clostridia bacterium]|nr:ATP-grasp fold amidoligase family protein [Clostridia bacterium]